MRMRKYLLLAVVLVIFLPNNNITVNADPIIRGPVIEILDLHIDGTGGVFVNLSKDFDYIMRLVYNLDFIDNSLDFDVFAGEAGPLTNGILAFYNDVSLLEGSPSGAIKSNDDFGNLAYDLSVLSDEKNPKGRVILGRLSFFKINIDGLLINDQKTLAFKVQDNMSALTSIDELSVAVEGYKEIVDSYFNLPQEHFFANAINVIQLRYLSVGQNYNLHINTSNDLDYWINTTAQEETIQIYFSQETATDTNVLNLYLYKGGTFKELRTWFVAPQGYNPLGNVINTLGVVIGIFAVGMILLGLFSKNKRR